MCWFGKDSTFLLLLSWLWKWFDKYDLAGHKLMLTMLVMLGNKKPVTPHYPPDHPLTKIKRPKK